MHTGILRNIFATGCQGYESVAKNPGEILAKPLQWPTVRGQRQSPILSGLLRGRVALRSLQATPAYGHRYDASVGPACS